MREETTKKRRAALGLGMLACSALFMLFFSTSTSPLFRTFGQDSAVFIMIGKGILQGKVPYVDLFENKGPLLYFIQAAAQLVIRSYVGVFIAQVLTVFLSLLLVHSIALTISKSSGIALAAPVVYLVWLALFFEGGNLSEEYSNFFTLLGLHSYLRLLYDDASKKMQFLHCFVLGLASTAVLCIRVNDFAGLLVIDCFALHWLLQKERRQSFLLALAAFLLGTIPVLAPILGYYAYHDALGAMVAGYLQTNGLYVSGGLVSVVRERLILLFDFFGLFALLPFAISLINCVLYYDRVAGQRRLMAVFSLVFSVVVALSLFVSHSGYLHYLITAAIPCMLSVTLLAANLRRSPSARAMMRRCGLWFTNLRRIWRVTACLFAITTVLYGFVFFHRQVGKIVRISAFTFSESYKQDIQNRRELLEHIPPSERDSIYSIGIYSSWYVANDILPSYKHFLLKTYISIDPQVGIDFQRYLEETPPKWMTTPTPFDELDYLAPDTIQYLSDHYKHVATDQYGQLLYRLK